MSNSIDKKIAGKVKDSLNQEGFSVFLAHEDIEPSKECLRIIEKHYNPPDLLWLWGN